MLNACIIRNYYPTNTIQPDFRSSYQSAKNSGDLNLCLTSLNLLISHSEDSVSYFDTIAHIYFDIHAYNQCIYWCKKSLTHNDSNVFALSMVARSYLKNADYLNAIAFNEQLIQLDPKPEYRLYMAEAQYRLGRFRECILTTESHSEITENYDYRYNYMDSIGQKQSTSLKSALLNYRGLAYFELNQLDLAELSFIESLKYDQEFKLAKFNLSIVRLKKTGK